MYRDIKKVLYRERDRQTYTERHREIWRQVERAGRKEWEMETKVLRDGNQKARGQ